MVKRILLSVLLSGLLVLSAAVPAAAGPPSTISFEETFSDVDPCTGDVHDVTIGMTFYVHEHDSITVARGVRTLATSSGYAGRGTSSYVLNGNVEMFRLSDILADCSGNRIRADGVFVLDLSSGTVRVEDFELTCLGS
jgi:hypothetical protein